MAADTPHLPDGTHVARPDRRAVIRGISAVGLAAFTAPLVASNAGAVTGAEPPPTPPKKKKGAAKGAKLVKQGNTPLASAEEIPVNSGMLFESDEYIVTQPEAGKFVGFDSLCTHEGCPIDVFDTPGEMNCSCHDSHFKLTDGSVISGPAKKPIPKKPILVEGGKIYKAKKVK
jgi:Rieske Fe-S protein